MMLLSEVFENFDTTFVTTDAGLLTSDVIEKGFVIPDCNRDTPVVTLKAAWRAYLVLRRVRPQVVISTGALPGLLCLALGGLLGARTIWLDSIANAERLSGCGRIARYVSDICVSQWEHVAKDARVRYLGSVI